MSKLNGIDVSGWDSGIDTARVSADFVIVKATEGTQGTVYNPAYLQMADGALGSGKLLGFYHYANGGDPIAEADSFFNAVRAYKGKALLCLDWEGRGNKTFGKASSVAWCKTFLDRLRAVSGSTPVIYMDKGTCNAHDWSMVARDYPLWGAEYAYDDYTYQGYESDPWQSKAKWGAWGDGVLMHQYGYVNPKPHNGGVSSLDGEVFYGGRSDWTRMCDMSNRRLIDLANEAAEIHYFMCVDPRFGYDQAPVRWGGDHSAGTITFTSSTGRKYRLKTGSYDCSSSVITAWRLVLQGTPYEGRLVLAGYTGDMVAAFVGSGLFTASLTPAHRGDLYVAEGKHTAMCQDGGSDGVFNRDMLSEFNRNERHTATYGQPGDQDGFESVVRGYYDDGWNTVLHYNHKADFYVEEEMPKQVAGKAVNNAGLKYQAHVQSIGWCDAVHDGQQAGTVGYGKRMEAIRFTAIPKGWEFTVKLHISGIGWKTYGGVKANQVLGTTGQGRTIECVIVEVSKRPSGDKRKLWFQVHQSNVGWKGKTPEGYASGTDGMKMRLEAVRFWIA